MLDRLYVDNYRCFTNFECRFGRQQLFLGPNGSGKSTVLEVLALLRDVCIGGQSLEDRFLGATRTRWQDVGEQVFELEVLGNGDRYLFRLTVDAVGNPARPRVVREELDFGGNAIFRFMLGEVHLFNDRCEDKVQYPFDWHRSALATITERKDNTKLTWFKKWLAGLICISPDPRRMSGLAEKETVRPASDLHDFANWYRHLRLESDDRALLSDLRDALEGFEGMDLRAAGLGNRELKLVFSAAGPERPFGFNELSDGQRVLIGLYTALNFAIQPESTVCFDEPDNFIALAEIEPWINKLIDRVEDAPAQVLMISHHPELLTRMAFSDGILFQRPEGRQTRVRPFRDVSQTGLSPTELISRGWERE